MQIPRNLPFRAGFLFILPLVVVYSSTFDGLRDLYDDDSLFLGGDDKTVAECRDISMRHYNTEFIGDGGDMCSRTAETGMFSFGPEEPETTPHFRTYSGSKAVCMWPTTSLSHGVSLRDASVECGAEDGTSVDAAWPLQHQTCAPVSSVEVWDAGALELPACHQRAECQCAALLPRHSARDTSNLLHQEHDHNHDKSWLPHPHTHTLFGGGGCCQPLLKSAVVCVCAFVAWNAGDGDHVYKSKGGYYCSDNRIEFSGSFSSLQDCKEACSGESRCATLNYYSGSDSCYWCSASGWSKMKSSTGRMYQKVKNGKIWCQDTAPTTPEQGHRLV